MNKLKEDIRILLDQIHSLNPDIAFKHQTLVNSFLLITNETESSWITNHHPLTGKSLHSQLIVDYEQLRELILAEVLRLRAELDQKEPRPPYDLQQELIDLRLRKRYLSLLTNYPHKLTSRSSLNEIRQTYEKLTASLRAKAREKINRLWDQLDVPNDQRIIPKTKDNEIDYLAMDDEINRLEIYVESIRPLLIKIQKREWFKKEMVEFEKHAGDPARLRGSSTQLLREEKFRIKILVYLFIYEDYLSFCFLGKDLSREFPKLTDDLRRTVAEWEESTGKKLIYGGEPYLETMNKEKLSVDFELLHLRLLTKCQLLVQPIKDDDTISVASSIQSPPSTPSSSTHRTSTSRIPTMSFTNSNRKIKKPT